MAVQSPLTLQSRLLLDGLFLDVLGVDHLIRGAARRSRATPAGTARGRGAGVLLLLVYHLGQLVRGFGEALGGGLHDRGRGLPLQRLLGVGESALELPLLVRTELLLVLVVGLLGRVDQAVELVARLHLLAALLVVGAVRLGVLDQPLD